MKKAQVKKKKEDTSKKVSGTGGKTICFNGECKLRKQGCKGFVACPGFKGG
jgi:hypothetical protein